MKKLSKISVYLKIWLFTSLYLVITSNAFAQSKGYYQEDYGASENGQWKLFTDFSTRSTTIRFFNKENQVIYEEMISGKYIKLTKRNVKILDRALARLMDNQLLSSEIKSTDLLATKGVKFNKNVLRDELKTDANINSPERAGLLVKAFQPFNTSKIKLIFENPHEERIWIILKDDKNNVIYKERSFINIYKRTFDFSQMKNGRYQLIVLGPRLTYTYQIMLEHKISVPNILISDPESTVVSM